jgi:beta-alanine--pyruvate transaminase
VFDLRDLDVVTDIRGYGLLAGIDVKTDGKPGARGTRLQKKLFWNGLHIKFTGDSGILAPAFVADRSHIDEMVGVIRKTFAEEK